MRFVTTYKRFPPGRSHIMVPTSSRSAARAGLAMYTPGGWKGELAQRAAWLVVGLVGPRALPGRAVAWDPALGDDALAAMLQSIERSAGPFDDHAVFERREERPGLLLVALRRGDPIAFLKAIGSDGAAIDREREALELLDIRPLSGVVVPRLLASGETDGGWRFIITTPLPPRMHRMLGSSPASGLVDAIQDALAPLTKPDATPAHWVPSHGDFTPWNLRRFANGSITLIDWEEACWAPPGADMTLYRAAAAALGRPVAVSEPDEPEAAQYWIERITSRVADHLSQGVGLSDLERRMLGALAGDAR